MHIDLRFINPSERIIAAIPSRAHGWAGSQILGQKFYVRASTVKEAEALITRGLKHAQAVSITVWPTKGYFSGRSDRKRWKGDLAQAVPGLMTIERTS